MQRCFEEIFRRINTRRESLEMFFEEDKLNENDCTDKEEYNIKSAYFEIYNEQIIDLLRGSGDESPVPDLSPVNI